MIVKNDGFIMINFLLSSHVIPEICNLSLLVPSLLELQLDLS